MAALVASWAIYWVPFFLINRAISATAGVLTIVVVYQIGRRLGGRLAGLIAAFFLALSFLHVRDSHFGTTDATNTLLIMLAVEWLLRSDLARWGRADVWAAVFSGLATGTKYGAALLALPLGVSQALHAWAQPRRRWAALIDTRALVIGGVFALVFLVTVPFLIFDYARFAVDFEQLLLSTTLGGHAGMAGGVRPWWYHLTVSLRYGVGLPLLVLGIVGIGWMAVQDWRRTLLVCSFPLGFFLLIASMGNSFVRYVIPIIPFLCISAAIVVTDLARMVTRRPGLHAVAGGLVAAVVIAPSARSVLAFDRILAQADNRLVVAEWMERHAAPGASVLTSGSRYGYVQLSGRVRPWAWDGRRDAFVIDNQPAQGHPDWILLQESPLPSETQPAVTALLRTGYELAAVFTAYDEDQRRPVYDMQDAFFVPIAGFDKVRRPGPNFSVYKHRDAASIDTDGRD
jgi:hypothetical protein